MNKQNDKGSKSTSLHAGAELTLAQYFGLIPKPPPLLTQRQWSELHLKSRLRQDSLQECPICKEDFRAETQVLLSCTHVFHAQCISSFERFARIKCCPLCRCEGYQKRTITDGAEHFRHNCATRIQAAARGWMARRLCKQLRRSCPPTDERLRRKWAAERLQEETDRMLQELNADTGDLDAFFAELDADVARSREITDAADSMAWRHRHQHGAGLLNTSNADRQATPITGVPCAALPGSSNTALSRDDDTLVGMVAVGEVVGVDWTSVCSRAVARGDRDCSICFGLLTRKASSDVAWLSCTHMFHIECITAFEAFEAARGTTPVCPICRGQYSRVCFSVPHKDTH